jgi:PAS domain S-box-containing protein
MNTILKSDFDEAMLDGAAMGVARMDTGEIIAATRLLEQMFGFKVRNKILGMNVDVLVPDPVRAKHPRHRETFAKDPGTRTMGMGLTLQGQRVDGSTFPVAVSLSGVVLSGTECVVFTVMDMTGWGNK